MALTVAQASAVNVIGRHLLATAAGSQFGGQPDLAAVRAALSVLADGAYRRLHAGINPTNVDALPWREEDA